MEKSGVLGKQPRNDGSLRGTAQPGSEKLPGCRGPLADGS